MEQRVVQIQHQRQLAVAAQLRMLRPPRVACAAAMCQGAGAMQCWQEEATRTGSSGAELELRGGPGCDARTGLAVRDGLAAVDAEAVKGLWVVALTHHGHVAPLSGLASGDQAV